MKQKEVKEMAEIMRQKKKLLEEQKQDELTKRKQEELRKYIIFKFGFFISIYT